VEEESCELDMERLLDRCPTTYRDIDTHHSDARWHKPSASSHHRTEVAPLGYVDDGEEASNETSGGEYVDEEESESAGIGSDRHILTVHRKADMESFSIGEAFSAFQLEAGLIPSTNMGGRELIHFFTYLLITP
jgi:hypothetical protein